MFCGQPYSYGWGMNPEYVEDGIHPNLKGLQLLATCIQKDVDIDMVAMHSN